jgi:glutamine phosphoribosylpyrophosphate amidotransferase
VDEASMAAHVGADSLHHISVDGLLQAIRGTRGDTCLACFTGQYPLQLDAAQSVPSAEPVTGVVQR